MKIFMRMSCDRVENNGKKHYTIYHDTLDFVSKNRYYIEGDIL